MVQSVNDKPTFRDSIRGLSLIELMVSVAIGLFVTAGLLQVYVSSNQNYVAINNYASLQEALRAGYQVLQTDIYRARHLHGLNKDKDLSIVLGGTVPLHVPSTTACETDSEKFQSALGQSLYGLNDSAGEYNCLLGSQYLRGDILVTRYALSYKGSMQDKGLYLRASFNEGKVFYGEDANQPENQLSDAIIESKLHAYLYYVGDSGRSCNGQPIPSLFRKAVNESTLGVESQELLPGVENIQFTYLEGGQYKNSTGISDWHGVEAIKIEMLIRAACPEVINTATTTYDMGDVAYTVAEKNIRRMLISQVVATRN